MPRQRVFIIAEAGSNWRIGSDDASRNAALHLIEAAKAAEADAVKFQVFRAADLYAAGAGISEYLVAQGTPQPINDLIRGLEMPYELLPGLAARCADLGIEFMATAFSPADLNAVDRYVARHKIASYEINHVPLLREAATTGKPLIMSTGAATEDDIAFGLDTVRAEKASNVTLLQCTSAYPAPLDDLNLMALSWLSDRFGVPVGLSDHSREPLVAPVAAVALGATCVEKHFTLDNSLPGPDHAFAILPQELADMVAAIRQTERALGSGGKSVQASEQELRGFAVRAIQARIDIQPGDELLAGTNIDLLRPGTRLRGLHPRFLGQVQGRRARRAIAAGDGVTANDLVPPLTDE